MWISPPQPDSHVWPIKYSHIIFCSFSLSFAYATQTHTQTHTHTCQVIHPRESIQHLVDKALSPATSPGLPFTGPWRFLMDHPRTRMNGASSPLLHLRCHFILSTLLICHSRWPFVTSLELLCTLHMHACLHMATQGMLSPTVICVIRVYISSVFKSRIKRWIKRWKLNDKVKIVLSAMMSKKSILQGSRMFIFFIFVCIR